MTSDAAKMHIDIHLVNIGWEITWYWGDEIVGSSCRDFGDSHDVDAVRRELTARILKTCEKYREEL